MARNAMDLDLLRELWLSEVGLHEMAAKLERTHAAVRLAAGKLGLPWRQMDGCIWSRQTLLDALVHYGDDEKAARAMRLGMRGMQAAKTYYKITDEVVAAHVPVCSMEELPRKGGGSSATPVCADVQTLKVAASPRPAAYVSRPPRRVAPGVSGAGRWSQQLDALIYDTGGRYVDLSELAAVQGLTLQAVTARWHVVRVAGRPVLSEVAA